MNFGILNALLSGSEPGKVIELGKAVTLSKVSSTGISTGLSVLTQSSSSLSVGSSSAISSNFS